MPKLNKEKFELTGHHIKDRTTFPGQVEMFLHYDTDKHFFYFEGKDLSKYLGEKEGHIWVNFNSCDTRQKAIDIVKTLLAENTTKTKMLRIELNMPFKIYSKKNPKFKQENSIFEDELVIDGDLPEYLKEMLWRSSMHGSGLSIVFERVMKIESNGHAVYANCNEKWEYSLSKTGTYSRNLVEWSPEREGFLISMQAQMDEMCKKVLDFFTAKNLNEFFTRLESNVKLISDGK